ncbi:hypothetical protein, partial [Staphylococcus aureus]
PYLTNSIKRDDYVASVLHRLKKDDEIVALKAQLEEYKKVPPKQSNSGSGSDDKMKKGKWMFVKPKDGESKVKVVKDKEYHWCKGRDNAHKPKWVQHHPSKCGKKTEMAPTVAPQTAPAPAATIMT